MSDQVHPDLRAVPSACEVPISYLTIPQSRPKDQPTINQPCDSTERLFLLFFFFPFFELINFLNVARAPLHLAAADFRTVTLPQSI